MLRKITLVVGSLVLALLLAEGVLRALKLAPTRDVYTVTERQFREVPGIYAPGQKFVSHEIPALPYRITINALGYRGRDFPRAKPPGSLRIFMAGDSNTYGDFVNDDETLPATLERLFQPACPSVHVINAGLRGGTIVGQAELIQRGLELAPDLVVLVFYENDVTDLQHPLWLDLERNRLQRSRLPLSLIYPLVRETALWNLALRSAATVRANAMAKAAAPAAVDNRNEGTDTLAGLKEQYANHLQELQRRLTASGIPLVFVPYPGHKALEGIGISADLSAWAHDTATRQGLWTVDVLTWLRSTRETKERLYLLPHDGHPSPRGHELVATFLHKRLAEHDVVRQHCGPMSAG